MMPDDFVSVAAAADITPGQMIWVAVDRVRIVIANVEGRFYALRDMCGHKNALLSRGRLDGCLIECPLHFAKFDVRSGKLVDGPVSADVPCYEVQVRDGSLCVKRPAAAS